MTAFPFSEIQQQQKSVFLCFYFFSHAKARSACYGSRAGKTGTLKMLRNCDEKNHQFHWRSVGFSYNSAGPLVAPA